jgi:hypothetical protein
MSILLNSLKVISGPDTVIAYAMLCPRQISEEAG